MFARRAQSAHESRHRRNAPDARATAPEPGRRRPVLLLLFALFMAAGVVTGAPPAHAAPAPAATVSNRPAWAPAASTLPANVEEIDAAGGLVQYRLKSNGMTILLAPDHAAPVFTFLVVYHVGSRNEAPGNTGSAHLLEHLLFNKSTENFGRAKGNPTFQEVLYAAGADFGSTNMTTWNDRMTGYSTLPSDRLELAMRIEADRLGRALILDEERQPEMSVVRNEYEIGENDPSTALWKAVIGAAIVAHPYHWDTIGYRSDIEGVSTDQLREHYRNFFWPDNSEAVLVGDFDPLAALRLFDREFGGFARSSSAIPAVITVEPPQEGERRVVVKRPGQVGLVQAGYIRPGALHPDFLVLDVLQILLASGVNSPLYRALVETGLASDVSAFNFTFRDPYPFMIQATVAPGHTHHEVEQAIKAVLDRVAAEGVSEVDLRRTQQEIEVAVVRSRDGTFNLASALGEAIASTSWKWFLGYVDGIQAVTADDVKRAAATYFDPDHATIGWFVPVDAANAAARATSSGHDAVPAGKAVPAGRPKDSPKDGAMAGPKPSPGTTRAGRPSAPAATFRERTLHHVLPNGIRLDIVENHAVPTVAIHVLVEAGRMSAPAKAPAVARLTADMLERGTTKRTKHDIAAVLQEAGARIDFEAGIHEVIATASGLSRDTGLLLDVLAEELMYPAFADSELARAKSEFRNVVLQLSESTQQMAFDRLTRLAFPAGHPYHAPTTDEMLRSIDAVTVDDLRAFHHQRYNGASLIIAIAGDVDAGDVARRVAKCFGPLAEGTRPAWDVPRTTASAAGTRQAVTLRGKANMTLLFGQASGLRRGDPDYEAALIANAALGQSALTSRIGKRVRDTEGLSYSLGSRFQMTDFLDGVWMTTVEVAPANLARAMGSTLEEIRRYVASGMTAEELETQKNFFAGNYRVRLGSNAGIAGALAVAEKFGHGPSYLDEFPERMRAVTLDAANRAIRDHMHPDRLHVIVAGDLEELPD